MALNINYTMDVLYTLDRFDCRENYTDILSETQLTQLESCIKKEFTIENTYCVISTLNGNKQNINITIQIYKNSDKSTLLKSKSYDFTPSVADESYNFIKQGYEYLKTLPEFAGAIDILEDGQ